MNFLSYMAGTLAGLILFGIGLIGLTGIDATPVESLTILLEPTGFGGSIDSIYLGIIVALGIWLVLFVWVKLAAYSAFVVILSKILLLHGWLPLAMTVALCALLSTVIATQGKKNA